MLTRVTLAAWSLAGFAAFVAIACSSSSADIAPTPDGGENPNADDSSVPPTAVDSSVVPPADSGSDASSDASASDADAGSLDVSFRYEPSWSGVTAVDVIGAFGTAQDWTAPFLTLTSDGHGAFTGTATVPAGAHAYLFRVHGDSAAAAPAAFVRYALDPNDADVVDCPAASPTYTTLVKNPCSLATVPAAPPPALHTVTGTVTSGGHPVAGYLAVLERLETGKHHYFVDRTTTGADGAYTFRAAPGTYRMQVLHPTYLNTNDAHRNPDALAALLRTISTTFSLSADAHLNAAEVAFTDYGMMHPRSDAGALPTHFTVPTTAPTARLAVFGPGPSIGDPWFVSAPVQDGGTVFDGGFNVAPHLDAGVAHDASYWWGAFETLPAPDGGVGWNGETMVFPIEWR